MKNKNAWVGIGIFALVGIFMLIFGIKDYFGLKNATKVKDIKADQIKAGMMLSGETDIVWDYYCYETSDGNETYRWYLVPLDATCTKFIGVKVHRKLFDSYEAVYNSTADYYNGKTDRLTKKISYQGEVSKIKDEVKNNLNRYAKELGITNVDEYFLPYAIDLKTTKSSITNIIIGVVCLFLAILIFVLAAVGEKKDKQIEENTFAQIKVNPGWMNGYTINNDELSGLAKGNLDTAEAKKEAEAPAADAEAAASEGYDSVQYAAENAASEAVEKAEEAINEVKDEIVADKIEVL
ncbi:MAG: hypothetical protein J5845_04045 [Lachnospiraceae bacterium]|nr:hypothetical protein [Lachnospiraceae bacterium]